MTEWFDVDSDPLIRAGSSSTDLLLPHCEEPLLAQKQTPSAQVLVLNQSREFEYEEAEGALKRSREENVMDLVLASPADALEQAAKRPCVSPGCSPATSSSIYTPSIDGSDLTELPAVKTEGEARVEVAAAAAADELLEEGTKEAQLPEAAPEEVSLADVVGELKRLKWRNGAWERLLWVLCSDRGCLVPWRVQVFLSFFGGAEHFSVDDAQFLLDQAAFCGFRTEASLQRDVAVCAALRCYACAFCTDPEGCLTIFAKESGSAVTKHTIQAGHELREALLPYQGFDPAALRRFATCFDGAL